MGGPAKQPRRGLPPWDPTASDEEARAHVQERLNRFSKITTLSSGTFLASVLAMYRFYPYLRPARSELVHAFALGGVAILIGIWLGVLRRKALSLDALYWIDAFYMSALGAMLGISAYFSPDQRPAVYGAFIWESFMVFSRVLIVPSTARRTAAVTTASFLPLAVATVISAIEQQQYIEMPPVPFVIAVWWLVTWAVLIATYGSSVIYGLKRQAKDLARQQVGPYQLVEKIGEGGMGEVYRAHHVLLRRPTAVKLVKSGKVGAEQLQRFEREVRNTSRLTHPNTVAIFDYGRTPDGAFYYAMEYLDGVDLATLVARDGPQPASRVIHVVRQVCGALDEAHAMGLIHRDVKPANILLYQRGLTPDVAKIVDFGLVKELADAPQVSSSHVITGTPAYISPEAVTEPARVGPRSDLYALGAVAYFLLTGHHVFEGKTSIDVFRQHVAVAPRPPSERTTNPVPAALEAVILRCLAKDPDGRPASARALADELGALPAAQGWSEPAALAWWADWKARPRGRKADVAITVTVDIAGRLEHTSDAAEAI